MVARPYFLRRWYLQFREARICHCRRLVDGEQTEQNDLFDPQVNVTRTYLKISARRRDKAKMNEKAEFTRSK